MNISGNLIKIVKTIVLPGVFDDGTDNIKLKLEKARPAIIIPKMIRSTFILIDNPKKIAPNTKGIEENVTPYMNELHMLPNNIVLIEIGHVINLSNVFRMDSHGNTIGPIEVDVKKMIIPIIPDIK